MNGTLIRDLDSPLIETRIPRRKGWRPSRRQRRLGIVLGGLLVVSLAGWARLVATPPKLMFTNIAVFPVHRADAQAIHSLDNRLGREVEIDPVRAGRFTVLLDLMNEGRRPVRIRSLPDDGEWSGAMYASPALGFDRRRPEDVDEPFRPVTLGPGDSITVRYTFTFSDAVPLDGCMLSPDLTRALPVTYRKLGFRRTRWLPLEGALLSTFTSPRCDDSLKPVPSS
jgi:hypothetical protein